MPFIHPLSAAVDETPEVLGAKAHGLVLLHRLNLPVPAGFVISTVVCREVLRAGHFPEGFATELAAAVDDLERATGGFGSTERPLTVSVRSGAAVSMPGMMDTVLSLELTPTAAGGSATETLELAITAVCDSWDTPRARTFRAIHDIPDDLGTAVIVQQMVFGNRDGHSGSGVAFSRDPNTGARVPFGDILFGSRGDDVVAGRAATRPLHELADREPAVWARLVAALDRIEAHYRDSCCIEFTFEAGEFWILQVHRGKVAAAAAVRIAVALVEEGTIEPQEALRRITPAQLRHARTPRMMLDGVYALLAHGQGASPGVAVGRIATTPDSAVRMAVHGPVILVRPDTSPLDMHGLAASAGVLTAHGGPACHAAVVARGMNKPAVVGVADLRVEAGSILVGDRTIPAGTLITIDGSGGEVALGSPPIGTADTDPAVHRLLEWADHVTGDGAGRDDCERLSAARTVLHRAAEVRSGDAIDDANGIHAQ